MDERMDGATGRWGGGQGEEGLFVLLPGCEGREGGGEGGAGEVW